MITPHSSGGTSLKSTKEKILVIAEENLAAWAAGRALKNVVDRTTGYKI